MVVGPELQKLYQPVDSFWVVLICWLLSEVVVVGMMTHML
jgi:hypothetical protein